MIFDELIFSDDFTDSEIAYFDSEVSIDQNIIKFDISMNNRTTVDMSETMDYLFEYVLSLGLV